MARGPKILVVVVADATLMSRWATGLKLGQRHMPNHCCNSGISGCQSQMFSLHHSMPTDSTSCRLYCAGHGIGIWSAEWHCEDDPTTAGRGHFELLRSPRKRGGKQQFKVPASSSSGILHSDFRVVGSIPRPRIFKNLPFNVGFQTIFIFNLQAIRNNPVRVPVKVFEVFFKSQSAYCELLKYRFNEFFLAFLSKLF